MCHAGGVDENSKGSGVEFLLIEFRRGVAKALTQDEGAGEHLPKSLGRDVTSHVAVTYGIFIEARGPGHDFVGGELESVGVAANNGSASAEGGEARGNGLADAPAAAGHKNVVAV